MVNRINWEALEELEYWNMSWRATRVAAGWSEYYVPGEGDNPVAMIIGEAPGAQEEIKRRPFVGQAGMVLRDLMSIAGLFATLPEAVDADQRYIELGEGTGRNLNGYAPNCWLTNVVKFRPPRNRTPNGEEIMSARAGLNWEWHAIGRPNLIIPVGGTALHALRGGSYSILKYAGQRYTHLTTKGNRVTVWPMLHPSFVLRSNSTQLQESVEKDWEKLGRWISKEIASPIGLL